MCDFVRTDDGALDDVRSSMNFDIIYKDVTGSTNDDVWDLANHGAHPGVAVRALRQESGRGQWKALKAGCISRCCLSLAFPRKNSPR